MEKKYNEEIVKITNEVLRIKKARLSNEEIKQSYRRREISEPMFMLLIAMDKSVYIDKYFYQVGEFAIHNGKMLQGFYEVHKTYPEFRANELLKYKFLDELQNRQLLVSADLVLTLDQFIADYENGIAPFALPFKEMINIAHKSIHSDLNCFHSLDEWKQHKIKNVLDKYKHYIAGYSSADFDENATKLCLFCSEQPYEDSDLIEFENGLLCSSCYFYKMAEKHRLLYEQFEYHEEYQRYYLTLDGKYIRISFSYRSPYSIRVDKCDFVNFETITKHINNDDKKDIRHGDSGDHIRIYVKEDVIRVERGGYTWQDAEELPVVDVLEKGISAFRKQSIFKSRSRNIKKEELSIWNDISSLAFRYAIETSNGDEARFKSMYKFKISDEQV